MNDIFGQVANLGFPIVISIYLLIRLEGKVESLTISINELAKSIDLLTVKTPKGI
ncbi:YvrJ family protein [Alkaliphilus sp. MSJ-5]|uniref:YvrJ family protein n=1 Tax=Alkaliphilus flagellatus TaxID=2841507 RepID=A0ABS6G5G7_9FIRM|nr:MULTISPECIES: YvrJ family protein [Alkaliphilus]MBU5676650.1 YvrJ family protein [Alkaliphilus flagellatus]QUH19028.1 YvrJ family protein [Alkaliphilus sp. B6464]